MIENIESFKLELSHISKEYAANGKRNRVLDDVNGALESGSVVALVGENGSGKSTLLMILATLLKPTTGNVLFNGKDVFSEFRDYRKRVTYITEEPPYVQELTVFQNLRYFKSLFNAEQDEVELANKVGLLEFIDKKPTQLSKGYRQRLALAIGLLKDASIVLLDEPAEGLDIETKAIVKNTVKDLRDSGRLVVYVTHDDDEIEGVVDKVIMLKKGRVVFFGDVEKFWEKFGKLYAVTFKKGREKVSQIVVDHELYSVMSKHEVTHIRPLGLREIVNLGDLEKGRGGDSRG